MEERLQVWRLEKEVLKCCCKEMYYRVEDHLQTITSSLDLQLDNRGRGKWPRPGSSAMKTSV
jgi:two-component sensor histidine kinase